MYKTAAHWRRPYNNFARKSLTEQGMWKVWGHRERPKSFTVEEFQILWDNFSEARKISYVLSLLYWSKK